MSTKQVIVIRRDLKMRRGKEIAQGAHAATAWLTRRLNRSAYAADEVNWLMVGLISLAEMEWLDGSYKKVTLQVDTLQALLEIHEMALAAGLQSHLITDSGLTEFHGEPTVTALAIGPDYDDKIDAITGGLELY